MSKEDVGELPPIPRKRRALEAALDLHLALWLDGTLTPSERRRLQGEKDRRKALRGREERKIGLLVGEEGVTPEQLERIASMLEGATEIHHPGLSSRLHQVCKRTCEVHIHRDDLPGVVRASTYVIGAPKESVEPTVKSGVWEMIRYAKHRSLPVAVVLPSGERIKHG